MKPLVSLENVSRSFGDDPPIYPVREVSLVVNPGDFVIIRGESGCGKTTLLNLIGGLLRPDSGIVRYGDEDSAKMTPDRVDALHRGELGFIFQEPYLIQALTARENLSFTYLLAGCKPDAEAVDNMLEDFGLTEQADKLPSQLSLGQRRRLVIARALLADPMILLADEPTNDLDERWADMVVKRLAEHADEDGHCTIMVTHDPRYMSSSQLVYQMKDGGLTRCDVSESHNED